MKNFLTSLLGALVALVIFSVGALLIFIGIMGALVSVGMQFRVGALAGNRAPLALGLAYKLVLGPVLVLALYAGALGLRGRVMEVTLFEAGMAPMVGASIVAIQYGLNPPLVSLTVGVGTVLSFVTLPAWWRVFSALGLS